MSVWLLLLLLIVQTKCLGSSSGKDVVMARTQRQVAPEVEWVDRDRHFVVVTVLVDFVDDQSVLMHLSRTRVELTFQGRPLHASPETDFVSYKLTLTPWAALSPGCSQIKIVDKMSINKHIEIHLCKEQKQLRWVELESKENSSTVTAKLLAPSFDNQRQQVSIIFPEPGDRIFQHGTFTLIAHTDLHEMDGEACYLEILNKVHRVNVTWARTSKQDKLINLGLGRFWAKLFGPLMINTTKGGRVGTLTLKNIPDGRHDVTLTIKGAVDDFAYSTQFDVLVNLTKRKKLKILGVPLRSPRSVLKHSSLLLSVSSQGFVIGRDGFVRITVDGHLYGFSGKPTMLVAGLKNGRHAISVDCIDVENKLIPGGRGDSIMFTVIMPPISITLINPKEGALFSGGNVPIQVSIITGQNRSQYLVAITLSVGEQMQIFDLEKPVVNITDLPNGIHTVSVTLLEKETQAPVILDDTMVEANATFGYFITEDEEKRRSDKIMLHQLMVLDLISGKTAKVPKFLENSIMYKSAKSSETPVTAITVRPKKMQAIEGSKVVDKGNKDIKTIKCKVYSARGKNIFVVASTTTIAKLTTIVQAKLADDSTGDGDMFLSDEEGFMFDLEDRVDQHAEEGVAYFTMQSDSCQGQRDCHSE